MVNLLHGYAINNVQTIPYIEPPEKQISFFSQCLVENNILLPCLEFEHSVQSI